MSAAYEKLPFQSSKLALSASGTLGGEEPIYYKKRNYDMCMVFTYKTSKMHKFEEKEEDMMYGRGLKEPGSQALNKMQMWKQRRESILKSLQNCGLHLFCFYSRDRDEILVKIGADAQKLRDTAARMKYKLQLKKQYLSAYAEFRHDFPGRPELQFKDRRVLSHLYKTHTEEDASLESDAIFKTLDKIYLIHHIITSKDKSCAGINVEDLMHKKELRGYFPLHEDQRLQELSGRRDDVKENKWHAWFPGPSSRRAIRGWIMMDEDHSNRVRDYFGDRIAFYFLFMAFYWKFLIPVALIGLALQILDWLARTPDNMTAIPFCVLLSVWACFLPHFWRRQEAKYALGWGTLDMVDRLEACRPDHFGNPKINPVTGQVEPFYPWSEKIWKYSKSAAVLAVSGVSLVVVVVLLVFTRHQYHSDVPHGILHFQLIIAMTVEIINSLLTRMSARLTREENHRTQSDHDMHLLAKVMVFKFVNSFFMLYYIAFWKKHAELFGVSMSCLRNDCFLDLQSQLAVFVLFRLIVSNSIEILKPKVTLWFRSWMNEGQSCMTYWFSYFLQAQRLELADMSAGEQQSKKEQYSSFNEFDEALIAHGYATLFAVTSPWVCAATLIGVLFEIIIDSRGLMLTKQRPLPIRAKNNEPWNTAFEIYGVMAAFTNIFLLIFASEQYDAWSFTEKLALFVYLEHAVFLSRVALTFVFPVVPHSVDVLKLKQESIVHRCLENIKVEQQQDMSLFRDATRDQIEVFEHDMMEDDDIEPQLDLMDAGKLMMDGMKEAVQSSRSSRPGPL